MSQHLGMGAWAVPLVLFVLVGMVIVSAAGGPRALRPAGALMRRRMEVYASYPFAVFATFAHAIVLVGIIATVGAHLFPEISDFQLRNEGTLIPVYLTVGLIAWPAIWEAYEATHRHIRTEQTTGIFESLIATPVGVRVLPLAYLLMSLPVTIIVATVAYFVFTHYGGITFDISGPVQVLNVVLVLFTGLVMTWGLGLFLGALTTIYKQVGPIGGLLKMLMLAFSGIYIPLGVYPEWVQAAAHVLPLTWAFASIRSVFAGNPVTADIQVYLMFLGYALAIVAAGLWAFNKSIDMARRDGTTGGY